MTVSAFAAILSVLSLCISVTTAWLTFFRRGTVRMTQPTLIYFGPDHRHSKSDEAKPKIYLRTLLFATAKQGRVIETMYARLSRHEASQNFSVWVYGEKEKLERGSGLFIGETGLTANHYFLALPDDHTFSFSVGAYKLEVFAHLYGDKAAIRLFSQLLEVGQDQAIALREPTAGLYFSWGSDSSQYWPHVKSPSPLGGPEDLLEYLLAKSR